MTHLCQRGPRSGLPHVWVFPPYEPERVHTADGGIDFSAPKREVGTCKFCDISREHTNALLRGVNWGTVYPARRGGRAKRESMKDITSGATR